jgi:multiple antibiotic resistance protein
VTPALLALAVRSFLTLLVVIDPVGVSPVFLGLAGSRPQAERTRIARKAILVAGGLLVAFAVGGAWLLGHLGISMDAFRIAGGILLFRIAVDMVLGQHERETEEEEAEAHVRPDISVFPLAIPLIAGPGSLASVMILAGEAHADRFGLGVVLLMAAVVLGLCYAALQLSSLLGRLLGQTGVNVITRVLGVLLAALAVQYVADGVRGLLATAPGLSPA